MRVSTVLALVAAGATPVAVVEYGEYLPIVGDDLRPILNGDKNITEVANEVAAREFNPSVRLQVVGVETTDQRIGVFGEKIRPDHGHVFHVVRVRVENNGTMDVAVSNWHFSVEDEIGSDRAVELGGAHEDFAGERLRKGAAREGTLTFELRKGSHITAPVWEGDLSTSRVDFIGPAG